MPSKFVLPLLLVLALLSPAVASACGVGSFQVVYGQSVAVAVPQAAYVAVPQAEAVQAPAAAYAQPQAAYAAPSVAVVAAPTLVAVPYSTLAVGDQFYGSSFYGNSFGFRNGFFGRRSAVNAGGVNVAVNGGARVSTRRTLFGHTVTRIRQ